MLWYTQTHDARYVIASAEDRKLLAKSLGVTNVSKTFKQLECLRVDNNLLWHAHFSFKTLNHQLPDWLWNMFTVNEIRGTNTWKSNAPFVARTNTKAGSKMLMVKGPLSGTRLHPGKGYRLSFWLKKCLIRKQSSI